MNFLLKSASALILTLSVTTTGALAAPSVDTRTDTQLTAAALAGSLQALKSKNGRELNSFYRARDYAPVWFADGKRLPRAGEVLQLLRGAQTAGNRSYLNPQATQMPATPGDVAAIDQLLTENLLTYLRDQRFGRFNPRSDYGPKNRKPAALDDLLLAGLEAPEIKSWATEAGPVSPAYTRLKQAQERYQALVAAGGWPRIPNGDLLRPGESNRQIPLLRAIMFKMGDLPMSDALAAGYTEGQDVSTGFGGKKYDGNLEAAVLQFQERHGLDVDGVIGKQTRGVINVPAEERLKQITVNLERHRWVPDRGNAKHVIVNIPEFRLRGYVDGKVDIEMPVVVGRSKRPTPVMNDYIVNVKFNPDWTVPKSIAEKDILPRLQANPSYAYSAGLTTLAGGNPIDPYFVDWFNAPLGYVRFRQEPGPRNPLGQARFSLTNNKAIFLHDTPKKGIFSQNNRAGSSGCVRVGDAVAFSRWLLPSDNWSTGRIRRIMQEIEIKYVPLKDPVAVSLAYFTSWVDEKGRVNFRKDIYELDDPLYAKMI